MTSFYNGVIECASLILEQLSARVKNHTAGGGCSAVRQCFAATVEILADLLVNPVAGHEAIERGCSSGKPGFKPLTCLVRGRCHDI